MGIDYLVCSVCEEAFPDVVDYGFCGNCEESMCERCKGEMIDKYGQVDEDSEFAEDYGEDNPIKCDTCANPKPTLDKKKFEVLMYFLIKDAAKYSFAEFLEVAGLSEEDYEGIKRYLEETHGIKIYL